MYTYCLGSRLNWLMFFSVFLIVMVSCKPKPATDKIKGSSSDTTRVLDTVAEEEPLQPEQLQPDPVPLSQLADTTFIRLADYDDTFVYDMRYATENNFLKAQVYDCAECYTRVKTAKALIKANAVFKNMGYKIKFYDCYRPNSVQYKMWEIMPNPQYVANPVKGSIHNKGGAVDITLVDENGIELPMGTDFDFFGKAAHHDYLQHSDAVLANRRLLKAIMENHGFWSIRTEWWHYNLSAASNDPVANFKWNCK